MVRRGNTDDPQGNFEHLTDGGAEEKPGFQNARFGVLDAADGIELVEAGRKLRDVLVHPAG